MYESTVIRYMVEWSFHAADRATEIVVPVGKMGHHVGKAHLRRRWGEHVLVRRLFLGGSDDVLRDLLVVLSKCVGNGIRLREGERRKDGNCESGEDGAHGKTTWFRLSGRCPAKGSLSRGHFLMPDIAVDLGQLCFDRVLRSYTRMTGT